MFQLASILPLMAMLMIVSEPVSRPIELEPAGPWRVDYAEESCLLSRPFSGGEWRSELVATFEPVKGEAWLRLSSPEELRKRDDEEIRVDVDGVELGQKIHMNILKGKTAGAVREFWFRNFWGDVARAQTSLRFRTERHGDIQLNVAGLPKALKTVQTCIDDLHGSLGIDPVQLRSIKSWPVGHSGTFMELPFIPDGGSFTYRILFWVGPDGTVDDCRLLGSSGNAKFDANACEQLKKKGKFEPARNFAAKPVRAPVYEHPTVRTMVVRR